MILFCEDCGKQNDLPPDALAGGRAVFKCSNCSYTNDYSATVRETVSSDEIERFLGIVRSFPEIIGAFFYDMEKRVVGTQMPAILNRSDIETLGSGLVRSYADGFDACPDIDHMMVVISDKHFFVHSITKVLYVVIVTTALSLPDGLLKQIIGLGKEN